ncbi:MAG: DNA alkylation repair protein [Ferruginibacter sp.]
MAEPLRNIYNDIFFAELGIALQKAVLGFPVKRFVSAVKNSHWPAMELKQRMRQLSTTLHDYLEGSYKKKLTAVLKIMKALPANTAIMYPGLAYMFIPDFVEQYGLADIDTSLQAMEKINFITSCEFAVRPFLILEQEQVMKQMLLWSRHPHENIRRFASEGCRPRLPWALAVPALKRNPSPVLPILENLKDDPSVYVQRSVANHLNDISKDHPELVMTLAKKWQGSSAAADWIIKHGCRGLLKKGHIDALGLFGTGAHIKCDVKKIALSAAKLKIGEQLQFEFSLSLKEKEPARLRVEYAVYYIKANGNLSKKVFKINECLYHPGKAQHIVRRHSFKDLTTRKHYAGNHIISIVVNGNELAKAGFSLTGQ